MTTIRELEQRMTEHQRRAALARKAGDHDAYWQARRELLNAQAEYWNATRGTDAEKHQRLS